MDKRGFGIIEILVAAGIIIIAGMGVFVFMRMPKAPTDLSSTDKNFPITIVPTAEPTLIPGSIIVEARDGKITNYGENGEGSTYLAETSRGYEAYLAYKEAQVIIPFTIEKQGRYRMDFYTSDDGLCKDGDRNVTVFIDQSQKLLYNHKAMDTKGMVWLPVDTITLTPGQHNLMVTKRESTYAAFSFTRARFVPVD
ncbi:hypothetical protein HGA91_00155 [candidate division WWE3 bacterium]|nr:hypothetical protein [candidate division WWE3 bacterium]